MKVKRNLPENLLRLTLQLHVLLIFVFPDFIGTTTAQEHDNPLSAIKIGLLTQDDRYTSAVLGAELAVIMANEKGGFNGRRFQLVVRSMEGPWGTGSKQAVDLIFGEKVWALLGSHDGRNAHLVEQAATKSTVVFVSAWAADPTLSQAFVPWFFNCVPNDHQQAVSLIEEIFNKRNFTKIAVVYNSDYDSKMILNNFLKSLKMSEFPHPFLFNYEAYTNQPNSLTSKIKEADVDCILLFCKPLVSLKVARQLREENFTKPLFGTLMILNENELSDQELQYFDDFLSIPSGEWSRTVNKTFTQEFQKAFGKRPGMIASYAFDGMNVLIEAIRKAGDADREKIQKSIKEIRFTGVTGLVQFDDKGNRSGNLKIVRTKNGLPIGSE